MSYFHVFIQQESDSALRCFLTDLKAQDVARRIAKPYSSGGSLVNGGQIVPVLSLRRVEICATDADFETSYSETHAQHARRIDALNSGGGAFFLSPGPGHDDMADEWTNVTNRFLKGRGPGGDGGFVQKVLVNPTVSAVIETVLGGLILAVLVWHFNLK